VYKALQSTVGREVAVKIILPHFSNHPEFIRRFETEAHLIARLEHLHIVPLYDYWRDGDGAYLVMRWLRGGSLRDILQKGPIELGTAVLLIDQITSALSSAHRNNVIHRDLKPGNILLDEDNNAYLADFGIAKDLTIQQGITEIDSIVGSPDYLAPEQARSEPVTPQTDIYSLGVVLYEMLIGKHPFAEVSTVERLYKHLNDPLPEIVTLPVNVADEVNAVIQKATAKDPRNRFTDALELAAALRQAAHISERASVEETLTQREHEILQLIVEGHSNKEIADALFITVMTVKWYITQIYRKLGVRSRVQAIVRARELNLIGSLPESTNGTQKIELKSSAEMQLQNPYKGLRAFQAADNQDFFGREKTVEKLIKRLGDSDNYARFLAVIGPSGSGKSSLVKAGLIPALWRGDIPGSEKWFVVEMLLGSNPLDELEVALTRIAANQAGNLSEQLRRDERGLLRTAGLILPDDGSELVLVIDQFEEVFTLVEDESERIHFLDLLHTAVTETRSRVRVIITLRADFYDRPLHYPHFGELIRSRMETILPMSAEELERAITQPAARIGVMFEPGLVASIVSEVNYQPGALPLLQYALTELFEQRQGRLLTQEAYHAIGKTIGALAKRADEIYTSLDTVGREAVCQMFLRLVTLGEGTEDTRRRVARSELMAIAADPDLMDEIIDTFTAYRLLSLDNDPNTRSPTVELAHEAILREWERLRGWLNASRNEIRLQRQLSAMTAEWLAMEHDVSFLARGTRLEQFEKWAADSSLGLTPEERAYLDASIAERERQETAEQERQAREKRLERRSLNFLRALVGVLLLATLGAFGLTTVAVNNANEAQNNFITSERIRLASQAQLALDRGEGGDLPALLALRSLQLGYSPDADAALLNALSRGFAEQQYIGHSSALSNVAFSPDGRYVLTGGTNDNMVRLWDAQTGEALRQYPQSGTVNSAIFSPDGHTVLTSSNDGTARLWDTETAQEILQFPHPTGELWSSNFSPDGRYVATGNSNHIIYLWDAQSGQEVRQFAGHEGEIWWVGFSPDSQYLVSGSKDHTARLWDIASGQEIRRFEGHTDDVVTVRFSPDGRYLISASFDGTARLWNVATGREVRQFIGHTEDVFDASFSPDGRYIVTTSFDKTARLWDAQTGEELRQFIGHTAAVAPVIFSPNGEYVLTGSYDLTARLWRVQSHTEPRTFTAPSTLHFTGAHVVALSPDGQRILEGGAGGVVRTWDVQSEEITGETELDISSYANMAFASDLRYALISSGENLVELWDVQAGQKLREFAGHTGSVETVLFSPDNRFALTGSLDSTARLWDVQSGDELLVFQGHEGPVRAIALSPDGRFVLTGSDDSAARLWDAQTGDELRQFIGHTQSVRAVAFSPDSRYAVTAGEDETAQLWDVETGQSVGQLVGHTEPIWMVAFSPDGKYVLTGSVDETARLWDMQNQQIIRQFVGHEDAVLFATFSSDGQYVLTSDERKIYLWQANIQDLIEFACAELSRDFTPEERAIYTITDNRPTCPQLENSGQIAEVAAIWTPVPTQPVPVWTPIPLVPMDEVIEFVFLTDRASYEMGMPALDVYQLAGVVGQVSRIPELNETTLSLPLYAAAESVPGGMDLGPWPQGKPLGITLQDWISAEGRGTYTVRGERARLDLVFDNLIPNGVYTLWCNEATLIPAFSVKEEWPCGALDGSENTFIADENGHAEYSVEMQAWPPSTERSFLSLGVAYHSDGQTYQWLPGEFGKNVHVQMFYDFLPPGS
jgi:WD40 repeat protein/serine/threonine protein kinase